MGEGERRRASELQPKEVGEIEVGDKGKECGGRNGS